jgi:hypothetical protein
VPSLSVSWQWILTQELYQLHSEYHCTTAHAKSSIHTFNLYMLTSCTLLYSSSLLHAVFCHLLLLLRNSAHLYRCSRDMHHRKHICYPASPLGHWLDLQKTRHVTSTHCCMTSPQRKPCFSIFCRVCCGHCLAMDLHVTVWISVYWVFPYYSLNL